MRKTRPIISPEIYLNLSDNYSTRFNGLCYVFFNDKYLNYLDGYNLNPILFIKSIKIYSIQTKEQAFVAIIRNGSSLSSIDFECLIYLGFTEFVFFGYACGISACSNIGEVVLIEKAFIGEGVSQYYNANRKFHCTSTLLNEKIKGKLVGLTQIKSASCFSTDAFFMETTKLIQHLKSSKVDYIDMECSSLASISCYRNVKSSFLFCVSDLIKEDTWEYDNDIDLRKILISVFELLLR